MYILTETIEICDPPPPLTPCDLEYQYRSADGSCNNLDHPSWGQGHTPQRRFLLPDYDDGKVSAHNAMMKKKKITINVILMT
jgi:hypothetical protein